MSWLDGSFVQAMYNVFKLMDKEWSQFYESIGLMVEALQIG